MAVRGSASIDTGRFVNKDKEFKKKLIFPAILNEKINMKKVVFQSIKPWIKQEIDSLLGFDDDVVVNLIYNLLDNPKGTTSYPDGKAITVELMGFLEQDTMPFMKKLWTHLVDATNNKLGIPSDSNLLPSYPCFTQNLLNSSSTSFKSVPNVRKTIEKIEILQKN